MTQFLEIYLVDNGSLRPAATLALRALAHTLSGRCGLPVQAVSLLHSHKVPEGELGGRPATIVKRAMKQAIASGKRNFVIVPLFLGPSRAMTDYLPELIDELRANAPDLDVRIAGTLGGDDPLNPDTRLAEILADQIQELSATKGILHYKVALVDHGTPIRPVSDLRNSVAAQLSKRLSVEVLPCSMERRRGQAYDFNEPLLERIGQVSGFSGGAILLAMLFLLEGRHAGEGGDVATICQGLVSTGQFDRIERTPLIGSHPKLPDILNDRLQAVL